MVEIDIYCCRDVSATKFLDVNYSSADGDEVRGFLIIEKNEPPSPIWTVVVNAEETDEPDSGNGTVIFNCGESSSYNSGDFRMKLKLQDDTGTTPEEIDDFPADDC